MSVQAITFELLKLETSFLAYIYSLTISRSSLSIKVIGSRSRSNEKLTCFYLTATSVCHLYAIKTFVKVTQYQGQMKGNQFSVYLQMFL